MSTIEATGRRGRYTITRPTVRDVAPQASCPPPGTIPVPNTPEPEDDVRDIRGYRLPKACRPGYLKGRTPATKGRTYDITPPSHRDIAMILNHLDTGEPEDMRLFALIVLLWRTGLRISEALALNVRDLDEAAQTVTVRKGKGGKRRVVGMDAWGWRRVTPWLHWREAHLQAGPVFCVVNGPTAGWREWSGTDVRRRLRKISAELDLRIRINPHMWRHAHAVSLIEDEVDPESMREQMGHANLTVLMVYLRGIPHRKKIEKVINRPAPVVEM